LAKGKISYETENRRSQTDVKIAETERWEEQHAKAAKLALGSPFDFSFLNAD